MASVVLIIISSIYFYSHWNCQWERWKLRTFIDPNLDLNILHLLHAITCFKIIIALINKIPDGLHKLTSSLVPIFKVKFVFGGYFRYFSKHCPQFPSLCHSASRHLGLVSRQIFVTACIMFSWIISFAKQ